MSETLQVASPAKRSGRAIAAVRGRVVASVVATSIAVVAQVLPANASALFDTVSDRVAAIAISPSRNILAVAEGRRVSLFDAQSKDSRGQLGPHGGIVTDVAFSDGLTAATASADGKVRVFDVRSGRVKHVLEGHNNAVMSVSLSSNGRLIASGGRDGKVIVWNARSGVKTRDSDDHSGRVNAVAFSPNGRILASARKDIVLRDARSGRELVRMDGRHEISTIAFSPDGRWIASGSDNDTVTIWDTATGKALRQLSGHDDDVFRVAFSPDGHLVASASRDKTVRVWDANTGEAYQSWRAHERDASAVVFTGERSLLSGGFDARLVSWTVSSISDPQLVQRVRGIPARAENPNAYLFAVGVEDYSDTADVPHANNSARLVTQALARTVGIPSRNQILLKDKNTTAGKIDGELRALLRRLNNNDTLYFYYAGHGIPGLQNNNSLYIAPADTTVKGYENPTFEIDSILRQMQESKVGRVWAFMDTCFSGRVNKDEYFIGNVAAVTVGRQMESVAVADKITLFNAAENTEFANDYPEKGMRLFSYFVADGLAKGYSYSEDLFAHVRDNVLGLSRRDSVSFFEQSPNINGLHGDLR